MAPQVHLDSICVRININIQDISHQFASNLSSKNQKPVLKKSLIVWINPWTIFSHEPLSIICGQDLS